jgi:hypothetical protein
MMKQTLIALATVATVAGAEAQKAADLQKVMIGIWVVDEKARMEASPLYAMSTPEKKKELEKQMAGMPPVKFEFKASSWGMVGDKMVPYKAAKSAKGLVLETTDPFMGGKDELTLEYISDSRLRMTMKSQGVPLTLNRAK